MREQYFPHLGLGYEKSKQTIVPVLLSGGGGTRLWPLSRPDYPKQFHAMIGEQSLFQQTILRLQELPEILPPVIVANNKHQALLSKQLQQVAFQPGTILLEPCSRNTAPALMAVANALQATHPEALMLVLPTDHVIGDVKAFAMALAQAKQCASQGYLVAFGVVPMHAETGYGYLKQGKKLSLGGYCVERFTEKPDRKTAEEYLKSKHYFWNSGMFLFPLKLFMKEMQAHAPILAHHASQAYLHSRYAHQAIWLEEEHFTACPDLSIDYALMEKTSKAAMVTLDCGWSDLGAWDAIWEASSKDEAQNHISGEAYLDQTKRSYIHTVNGPPVAAIGIEDLVVISTSDGVLVATKAASQQVKQLVGEMKTKQLPCVMESTRMERPWGYYEIIRRGKKHQVKHLYIEPGQRLSLQYHEYRAEHWIILNGTARIYRDGLSWEATKEAYTYIPLESVHTIENIGEDGLSFIEVQHGSHISEDDIIRLEDHYGRVEEPQEKEEEWVTQT